MDDVGATLAVVLVAAAVLCGAIGITKEGTAKDIKRDCDNFGYVMLSGVKYQCTAVNGPAK